MFPKILAALCLMALCVLVHAIGVTLALRRMGRLPRGATFVRVTWLLVMLASWMILFHLAEITVWACYFSWWSTGFIFAAVNRIFEAQPRVIQEHV